MLSTSQSSLALVSLTFSAFLALACSGQATSDTTETNSGGTGETTAGGTSGHTTGTNSGGTGGTAAGGTGETAAGGTSGHTDLATGPQLARPVPHGSAPSDVLLCEEADAGWSGRTYNSAGLPGFVVYGDGLIVSGPDAAYSYEMRQARVNEAGIQFLLARLDDLGLFATNMKVTSSISDAASSSLRLTVNGYDRLHTVYPAGEYGDSSEGKALQQAFATLRLGAFPSETVVEPERELEYSRVSVRVRRTSGLCDDAPAWPLDTLPALEPTAQTCLDLDRKSAAPLAPVEPGFDNDISMRAGDVCLRVTYRPVLPHESACADGEPSGCGF